MQKFCKYFILEVKIPVKSVPLVGKYSDSSISKLSLEDYHHFKKLLKDGRGYTGNDEESTLYIMPFSLDYVYSCLGFVIEHHRFIVSKNSRGENRIYLVFRAIHFKTKYAGALYSHYCYESFNKERFLSGIDSKAYYDLKRLDSPIDFDEYSNLDNIEVKLPR